MLVALLLAAGVPAKDAAAAAAPATDITIFINGQEVVSDVPPRIVAGRTLVPIRVISQFFGAAVDWDGAAQRVDIQLGPRHIALTIGVGEALVDDQVIALDQPPQIVDGRTLVPLRFAGEALGARVDWDEDTRTVLVEPAGSTLKAIEYAILPVGIIPLIQVEGLARPRTFILTEPDRLVLDFPNTIVPPSLPPLLTIEHPLVHRIRVAQFEQGVARVVVDLTAPAAYSLYEDGGTVQVLLAGAQPIGIVQAAATPGDEPVDEGVLGEMRWDERGVDREPARGLEQQGADNVAEEAAATVTVASAALTEHANLRARIIVVDAGHGGRDPGSIDGRIAEKQLTLAVALQVQELLAEAGARVIMTRTRDTEVDNYERAYLANDHDADVFVSIHFNAYKDREMAGTETYHYGTTAAGKKLAQAVHNALLNRLGRPDRGVRTADFIVLRETAMPAILVESMYLTNPDERAAAADPAVQREIAMAIVEGLATFLR